jgi:hypothetical protein
VIVYNTGRKEDTGKFKRSQDKIRSLLVVLEEREAQVETLQKALEIANHQRDIQDKEIEQLTFELKEAKISSEAAKVRDRFIYLLLVQLNVLLFDGIFISLYGICTSPMVYRVYTLKASTMQIKQSITCNSESLTWLNCTSLVRLLTVILLPLSNIISNPKVPRGIKCY